MSVAHKIAGKSNPRHVIEKTVGKKTRYERWGVAIYRSNKVIFENI